MVEIDVNIHVLITPIPSSLKKKRSQLRTLFYIKPKNKIKSINKLRVHKLKLHALK